MRHQPVDTHPALASYRAATTPIIAASAPAKTGVTAAARLPLTDEAVVVVLVLARVLALEATAPVPLELSELEVELADLVVTLLVVVLVDVESLEMVAVVVITIVPEEVPDVVVVAEASPELYIAHSWEPTVAAIMRSEAAQAPIRQGAAREPMAL